ncbi:MAG: signal recognition particle-docking protein FtsY, partial [Pseudomonadota bacterium]
MFEFIRRKKRRPEAEEAPEPEVTEPSSPEPEQAAEESVPEEAAGDEPAREQPGGLFNRLRQGLSRTRSNLADGLTALVAGRKTIDPELLDDIETQLLTADFGLEATDHVIEALKTRVKRRQLSDPQALMEALKDELRDLLAPCSAPLRIDVDARPWVMLVTGVNGVGKTTTIGKLARRLQEQGKTVMLAAGDTFRAAAVEQLQVWGERNDVPVIAQATGSDSASVIFDAYQAAKAR